MALSKTSAARPKHSSRPTIRKIGITLAEEMAEIVDRLGMNHPDLPRQILGYIEYLNQRHPEWTAAMNQTRERLIGGKLRALRQGRLRG